MSEENAEEHRRLLVEEVEDRTSEPAPNPYGKNVALSRTAAYCLLLYFLVEMYDMILVAPLTALFEQSLCRRYYEIHDPSLIAPGGSVHESFCKLDDIQAELAIIRGWKLAFDALPVFLVAIPFGKTADRVGRKTVFTLSVVGLIAGTGWIAVVCKFFSVFPLKLVWLSSAFYLCGGGLFCANSMIFTMTADCCSEAERSRTFYYVYSAYLLTELVAPSLASVTMNISIWLPFIFSLFFLLLCLPIVALVPDTRALKAEHGRANVETLPNGPTEALLNSPEVSNRNEVTPNTSEVLLDKFKTRNMALAVPVFLVGLLRPSTLNVLLQYTSKYFGWKLSEAAILISEVAVVNLILFLVIVPQGMKIIHARYHLRQQVLDLAIVRGSMLCLSIGALCLGLAPNIPSIVIAVIIFATGFGCRISMLSLVTSWVGSEYRGRLYGAIQIIENVGLLVAELFLQNVFAASMKLSRSWSSLTFYVAAVIYTAVGICTLFINPQTEDLGH